MYATKWKEKMMYVRKKKQKLPLEKKTLYIKLNTLNFSLPLQPKKKRPNHN